MSASDGEVWGQMINAFNEAHKDSGVSIRSEVLPYDQYVTKVLVSSVTGQAPDFGWGDAGTRASMVKEDVVIPLDELATQVGLDFEDFDEALLETMRYRKYSDSIYGIPMDAMSMQSGLNLDHVAAAGLPIPNGPLDGPQDGEQLLEWARAMTVLDGDRVSRSGFLMTASGPHPAVTWGIVAHQLGFRTTSDDLTTALVNPDAGKEAMQWVLDLFDKEKVSTRDVSDRYKAFGAGEASIFWTGPWTLNGYRDQGLNLATTIIPKIGNERATFFAMGGLEIYRQADSSRYEATMEAIKWLSDHSFLWTTVGRGVSPRKSIRSAPEYAEAGHPWSVRGAYIEGLKYATIRSVPVPASDDFSIYKGTNFTASILEGVWAGKTSIDEAMERLGERWQDGLDDA
jgi:ABC-type glycerol-3-phosphate transport system substrate-binding protein